MIVDRDGQIIRINAQAENLFGYLREELLGQKVEILMPLRFRERHVERREAYCADPKTRPMQTGQQLLGLRKDGHVFPTEISLCPLLSEDGFVIASAIRDVSKQRRLEHDLRQRTEELEAAARHEDEFLGKLAHELRNPIGTIRNAVQVLKQGGTPSSSLRSAQDVIGRQADHMAHLVEDLLDASRIVNGKLSLQHETVELRQIVGQAAEACRHLHTARDQQLTVSLPSRPIPFTADPTRLVQILTNLLNNAAKYTENGGKIWLAAAEESDMVVMRVRDNGIGIASDMLPRILTCSHRRLAQWTDRMEASVLAWRWLAIWYRCMAEPCMHLAMDQAWGVSLSFAFPFCLQLTRQESSRGRQEIPWQSRRIAASS